MVLLAGRLIQRQPLLPGILLPLSSPANRITPPGWKDCVAIGGSAGIRAASSLSQTAVGVTLKLAPIIHQIVHVGQDGCIGGHVQNVPFVVP